MAPLVPGEALGYCVVSASNGLEALKLFSKRPFDLVIVDTDIPGTRAFSSCSSSPTMSIGDLEG
jgi:YesN/AraC family two-component response regulator